MDEHSTEQSLILQLIEEFLYPEKRHFRILEAAQSLIELLKQSENKKRAIDFIIEHLNKLRQEAESFFSEELAINKAISTEEKNRWLTLHQEYMDALLVWIEKTLNGKDTATDIARLQAKRDNLIEQSKQHLHARIDNAEAQKEILKKQIEAKLRYKALLESSEKKTSAKEVERPKPAPNYGSPITETPSQEISRLVKEIKDEADDWLDKPERIYPFNDRWIMTGRFIVYGNNTNPQLGTEAISRIDRIIESLCAEGKDGLAHQIEQKVDSVKNELFRVDHLIQSGRRRERCLTSLKQAVRILVGTLGHVVKIMANPQGKDEQGSIESEEQIKKITKLTDFIRNCCEDTPSISSKANRIHEFVKKGKIKFMPKTVNKPKGHETKLYNEEELRQIWPKLKEKIKSLPNLKD